MGSFLAVSFEIKDRNNSKHMNNPKIVTHAGLSVDLSKVKSFKLSNHIGIGKENTLIIEFKQRFEYIFHPGKKKFVKQEFNDQSEVEFASYRAAEVHQEEWVGYWQDYLNEH